MAPWNHTWVGATGTAIDQTFAEANDHSPVILSAPLIMGLAPVPYVPKVTPLDVMYSNSRQTPPRWKRTVSPLANGAFSSRSMVRKALVELVPEDKSFPVGLT
ncbi:MAG TPA: hypothetical protein VGM43_08725 [Bryobacteraceae bacterium]